MNTSRISEVVNQTLGSFLVSASLHYLVKRQKNAALIGGGIAAGLTIIDIGSMIYPAGEHDDEIRVFYKPALIVASAIAMTYFTNRKIDFARSIIPSICCYWTNYYFVWLRG